MHPYIIEFYAIEKIETETKKEYDSRGCYYMCWNVVGSKVENLKIHFIRAKLDRTFYLKLARNISGVWAVSLGLLAVCMKSNLFTTQQD